MTKRAKNGDNFVDALDSNHRYVVLTKTGRIQILIRPTAKQMRQRGKRGWQLYRTLASSADAGQSLLATIQDAIWEAESTGEAAGNEKAKVRPSKH
jgi:hypothetical protein